MQLFKNPIIMFRIMVEEYQPLDTGCPRHCCRHARSAVPKPVLGCHILLLMILRIMNQDICPSGKANQRLISVLWPLDIGSKNEAAPTILDTRNKASITRVRSAVQERHTHSIGSRCSGSDQCAIA